MFAGCSQNLDCGGHRTGLPQLEGGEGLNMGNRWVGEDAEGAQKKRITAFEVSRSNVFMLGMMDVGCWLAKDRLWWA